MEVTIDLDGQVPGGLERAITPIRLTGIDLRGYGRAGANWIGGVYFGDAKHATDLVTFWNLRAAGNEIEFAPLADLARMEDTIRAHLKYLDELPDQHPNVENHIVAYYRQGRHHQEIAAVLGRFPTMKRMLLAACDDTHLTHDPALFCFDREQALAFIEHETQTYSVLVTFARKAISRSVGSIRRRSEPRGVSRGACKFRLPRSHSCATISHRADRVLRAQDRDRSVDYSIRKEGIGVFTTVGDNSLRLRPVKEKDIIRGSPRLGWPHDRAQCRWTTFGPAYGSTRRVGGCARIQDSRRAAANRWLDSTERHRAR